MKTSWGRAVTFTYQTHPAMRSLGGALFMGGILLYDRIDAAGSSGGPG
jgi:hypothetical protein